MKEDVFYELLKTLINTRLNIVEINGINFKNVQEFYGINIGEKVIIKLNDIIIELIIDDWTETDNFLIYYKYRIDIERQDILMNSNSDDLLISSISIYKRNISESNELLLKSFNSDPFIDAMLFNFLCNKKLLIRLDYNGPGLGVENSDVFIEHFLYHEEYQHVCTIS
jgi:hypothetical protein